MSTQEISLKEKLKTFGQKTTCHAIPNAVTSDRILMKIFWLTCFIVFSAISFLFVRNNVMDYLSYSVDTEIVIERDEIAEFPTITFCNLQICGFKDYEYASYLKKYKHDEEEKFSENREEEIDKSLREQNTKTSYFSAKEVFLRKYDEQELTNILNKNKTSVKKMLISCKFGGNYCNENDFEFFQMGEFSKCYKFNSGIDFNENRVEQKKTNRFGKSFGLQMELYIGTQEDCKSPLSTTSGLVIYVHNYTYTLTEEDNGIQVQPGTETDIAIDRTIVKKLDAPFSECFKSESSSSKKSVLVERTINLTKIYTQQYCLQLCYQDFLIDFCECYDHTLPYFTPQNLSACPKFIDSLYNCQYLIKRLFYNGKNDEHCLKDCPKECDYIKYDTTISYAKYPTKSYFSLIKDINSKSKIVNEGEIDEEKSESVVSVNVFYNTGSYTKITEKQAIEAKDLFANIGGTLGLFLGISFLSFVEIVEIFIEICYSFKPKKQTSNFDIKKNNPKIFLK